MSVIRRFGVRLPMDLTSLVSLLCFGLALVLSAFYYFSIYSALYLQVFLTGLVMLTPMLLQRAGFKSGGKLMLAILVSLIPFGLSLYNKQLAIELGSVISPVNYFDVRLMVMCSILVPMTIIPLRRKWLLLAGMLPSFLGTVLYDPVHDLMGVGYYDVGLDSPDYYFSVNLFAITGWIFLVMAFLFLKYTIELSLEREKFRRNRLEQYMHDLLLLGNSPSIISGELESGYCEIVRKIRSALVATGVAIYEFDDNFETLTLRGSTREESAFKKIRRKEHEAYFRELLQHGILISNQGQSKLANGKTHYAVHDGLSYMDIIFLKYGRPHGVLSCEIISGSRQWSPEDTLFVKAACDLISIMHANHVSKIRNQELEQRVEERTAQLKKTNLELQEYAFLNSHILRAPIARVFGMYQVIEAEYSEMIRQEILDHFKISIEELDKITRRIDSEIAELTRT